MTQGDLRIAHRCGCPSGHVHASKTKEGVVNCVTCGCGYVV